MKLYWLILLLIYAGHASAAPAPDAASGTRAAALNERGVSAGAEGRHAEARRHLLDSAQLARQQGDGLLAARALGNAARASLLLQDYPAAAEQLHAAARELTPAADNHAKAFTLTALGTLWTQYARAVPTRATHAFEQAYGVLTTAAELAERLDDQRTLAYAWGYLGELYESQQRYDDALILTRRAAFAAQQAHTPESLYRWQWQLGRLLNAQGERDAAIAAYQGAVATLQSIRSELTAHYRRQGQSFQSTAGRLYFDLADLLLHRAPTVGNPVQKVGLLRAAQDTVEQLKSAELTDYFQDDCVAALQARSSSLEMVAPDTAVVYPILLPDRIELLLSFADTIQQATVPVDNTTLTRSVRRFREQLENFDLAQYLPLAQQLYQWLVKPLEPLLSESVQTLVFVPDGPLRTIPLAALHDGRQFLIARYAVATTPGLTLTDFRPSRRQQTRLLLNGLTEAVQDFPPLPNVAAEINAIEALYGGTVLKDQTYLLNRVQQELTETPYSIVHIASHGQFTSDVNNTFVLTYDDKLTLNRLEQLFSVSQYRDQPVELLTLSACQTALGDDRAALGLAGVAVKSGARSALASLWLIEDRATALLIGEFYRQLQDPALSNAQALRRAQLSLINNPPEPNYRHPSYWAPFLLIGNWL